MPLKYCGGCKKDLDISYFVIGNFNDDNNLLLKAIEYLKR